MMRYTALQLELIAHAIRDLWASCYRGTVLPGMRAGIGETGTRAYEGLLDPRQVQIFGGEGTSLDIHAIISMGEDGVETAQRIRDGYAPFDMKPGFLNSRYAKTYKGGKNAGKKYFVMGFRHTTPKASGRIGRPMTTIDYKRAKGGDNFPEQMEFINKDGDNEAVGIATKVKSLVNIRATKSSTPMPENYEWRNGILAGMTKTSQTLEGKNHTSYRTFRVITPNSPSGSWWHPGQDPNDVIGSVVNYVKPILIQGLEQSVKKDVVNMIQRAYNQ